MARCAVSVFSLVTLLCASLAAAAPCIECKDCQGMQTCLQVCQQTCTKASPYDPAACKNYGQHAASSAAQKACTLAMDYCGGSPVAAKAPQVVQASSSTSQSSTASAQCANIAFDVCHSKAMDSASSPCGQMFNSPQGYKQCNGKQFVTFYAGIVNDACRQSSNSIAQGIVIPSPGGPAPAPVPVFSLTTPVGSVSVTETVKVGGRKLAQAQMVRVGGRKLAQSSVIIKNPTTVGPKGATASSIEKIPVPAGAQVALPGQPIIVGPGGQPPVIVPGQQPVVLPGTPQVVVLPPGQLQPGVVYPGQPGVVYPAGQVVYPAGQVVYPAGQVVYPGQPQVILQGGH